MVEPQDLKPRSILLAGASSQIGRFALPRLAAQGFTVHALSRNPPATVASGIIWHRTDIVHDILPAVDAEGIIHLAHLALLPRMLASAENTGRLRRVVAFGSTSVFSKQDSPDPRGIDVALIYRPDKFKPVTTGFIPIRFPFDTAARTRDILYVKGVVLERDTLHVIVNHWPSRFGGYTATIPKRNYVASVLRQQVDSIVAADPAARILIMGDLNDEPTDESVAKVLKAKQDSVNLRSGDLYNMMTGAGCSWDRGTIKDRELWITIDQFIVTAAMLQPGKGLHTSPHSAHILDAPFLLQPDDAWFGQKPFRTYFGVKYIGGFSDHLPIYMDLTF